MPEITSHATDRPQALRSQAWRLDCEQYPLQHLLQTRERDLDHQNHVNHVAVLSYFSEFRATLHRAWLGGLTEPLDAGDAGSLLVSESVTEFLLSTTYPAPVTIAARLLAMDQESYRMAAAVFQGGRCTSLQESTVGFQRNGRWSELPKPLRAEIGRHLSEDAS